MVQVNRTVFAFVLTAFIGVTLLTSVTRVDAQESRERERSAERRAKMQQFEHLSAAHKHLKYGGGNEELSNMVGKHAREMANSLDIDYDQVLRRFREQDDGLKRETLRFSNDRNDEERYEKIRYRDNELRDADAQAQNGFQNEVRGTLRELLRGFQNLREDVEKLKKAGSGQGGNGDL